MQFVRGQLNQICRRLLYAIFVVMGLALAAPGQSSGATLSLQGQSKGSTSWITGNLLNWLELDYIPCRVYVTGGPITSQSITLSFPHLTGTTPGFQDLLNFTASANAKITSGPTLATPSSGTWSYTFKMKVTNSQPAYVQFQARLAAGAHLNTGSSLMLSGNPTSMGNLQIHKPAPGPGAPDLAILKTGPATAFPGGTITYSLSYTNKAAGTNTARGTQLSDVLPAGITAVSDLNGGALSGNTIFWDLGNLAPHASGKITFQARINPTASVGTVLTNFGQALSSENDANPADNAATANTTVICQPATATELTSLIRAVGANALFSTTVSGTGPFSYQWLKNGNVIGGQSANTLTLVSLTQDDAGIYSVIVSGACNRVTNNAVLVVDTCFPSLDVMLVIDRSGSMTGQPYSDARQACSNFVHNLNYNPGFDQAGLASYNPTATLDQTLTNSMSALEQAIHSIPGAGGLTSITLGLQTAQAELASSRHNPQAMPILVLLSDGLPTGTDTKSNALYAATQAKNAGTRIFTVGLGGVDPVLMAGIASSTNDYFFTTNSSQLTPLFNAISTIICRPPTNIFLTGPSNLTVCAGSPAAFSVAATGCSPFTYQWKRDGAVLAGQTNEVISLSNVSTAEAGMYSVEVSGPCRTVTNSAVLTVNSPAVVNHAPVDQTQCPGGTAVFSVDATGTGLGYQWYKNANALNGETGSWLTLSNVSAGDDATYSVVISGMCGGPVTNSATLAVNTVVSATPLIGLTNCPGTPASFITIASGTGPFNYQWLKNGNPIGDQTGNSLTLNNVSAADQGTYSVIVSGACGSVTNGATLTVNTVVSASPLICLTNCPGTKAFLSTTASGTGPFNYQWLKNGSLIGGQTGNSLTLNNVSATDQATYSVIVSGACGSVTNSATLTVNTVVSASPLCSLTNCPGTTAIFSTTASGTGPFGYQWLKNGDLIGGQSGNSLTLNSVSAADQGTYSVIVSGACGSVTNSATLTLNTPVSASPLISLTNCPGTTAFFSTIASGTGPLSYRWLKNGNILDSQSGNSLTLNSVSAADEGTYLVIVSGACGSVTNPATLTVNTAVSASPLLDLTNCPGTTAFFSTIASGTGPLSYQWLKDGDLLDGQTNSSLNLNDVSATDQGTYSVIVSGACGSVTNDATLTVRTLTAILPIANLLRNPGESARFDAIISNSGPYTLVWKKNGLVISGQSDASLSLNNVTTNDDGVYSVEATGTCLTATKSAALHVNLAPTISLFSPTNGQVFLAPAAFAVAANAADQDGIVTNVEFFVGTNKFDETTNGSPYVVIRTNVAAGDYTFTAKATDDNGLSVVSLPISITVLDRPPLTILSATHFNPQTGFYEQSVRVGNPTRSTFDAVRVYVTGLPAGVHVFNASGTTNGLPYVQSTAPVPSGGHADFVIEYYVTSGGVVPNPILLAEAVSAGSGGGAAVSGAGVHINRQFARTDGTFMIEFLTETNRVYYIQYAADLRTWKTAQPAIAGNGTWIQWIDAGQPKTESAPAVTPMRFYRVIVLP